MAKLLRSRKRFGRCRVQGHGSTCEVAHDIQDTAISRAEEKEEWTKMVQEELNDKHCPITGNPCLTDTWNIHKPPHCECGNRIYEQRERECSVSPFSSACCELGTKGCEVDHSK